MSQIIPMEEIVEIFQARPKDGLVPIIRAMYVQRNERMAEIQRIGGMLEVLRKEAGWLE